RAADPDVLGHAQQRLHVVDRRRLAEQPRLSWERRFIPRLSALALNRVEQRGLLARYVGASPAPDLEVEREPPPHHVRPQGAARGGLGHGLPPPRTRP